ncbi:MAG: hypothetical protein DPW11_02485 [bacterium]|nr:hypothetical protein [bacterium]RIK52244.1 MAG: hypothetical protein DCC61_00455 [Candidatus Microgenomates bacterium]
MKKLIPLALALTLVTVGGYFYMNNKKIDVPQSKVQQVKEATEWAAAIASGRPTLCTMTKGEEKMDYLIKGKKMKATMVTMVESKKMTSYMLNDEKYLYMWEDGKDVGTKMTIPTEDETKKMTDSAKEYSSNMPDTPTFDSESGFDNLKNEGYTIKCDGATASDSDFVPPQSVKFTDLSEMTKAIPSPNANGEYDMKALEEMAKKYGATMPSEE